MKKKLFHLLALVLLTLASCGGGNDDEQAVVLPTNLVADIAIKNDGSGEVTVTATADNENFFTVYFGDTQNEIPVKTTSGIVDHKYYASANYTIKVRAHATNDKYIEKTFLVTIDLSQQGGVVIPSSGYTSPTSYAGMSLVWQEDFTGTTLNSAVWTHETGTGSGGWGNNELQYYRAENTTLQDGYLVITARKENFGGSEYTSSRIISKGKKTFQYGRIDIRAVLPKGQGMWPALWMLGNNISSVPWPACGEIDIMELVGGSGSRDKTVYGTLHWSNVNGDHTCSCGDAGYTLSSGTFHDEFHVFSIVWDTNSVKWLIDNVQYHEVSTSEADRSEFDAQFFFIMNIAVGGNWPGSPDATTIFPQHMIVDYIRVFQ